MQPTPAGNAPPPAAFDPGGYPVQTAVNAPDTIDRWRVLQYFLAIPQFIVLGVLMWVAELAAVVAWFSIVFTGKESYGLWDFRAGVLRWQWRVLTYAYFLHDKYPPFELASGETDPATEPALFAVARPQGERNRLTVGLRFIWAIPAEIFSAIIMWVVAIATFIAWFAVLFTGRWPEGLRKFVLNGTRLAMRVNAYALLLTDEYPPFALEP